MSGRRSFDDEARAQDLYGRLLVAVFVLVIAVALAVAIASQN